MRFSAVLHIQGLLALLIATCMLVPLGVSLYYGEGDALAFGLSILATALVGLLLWLPFRSQSRAVTRRESLAIVSFGWILASAFAAIPFMLTGATRSFVDAYFETMSGFTTTGASILAGIEPLPHGILFWRSFTQWLGGMGIIVLFVAILPILGVGAAQMVEYEAPGPPAERLTPRIRQTAKALWLIYVVISAAEVLLLLLGGMSLYDAVTHMFTTMATGGYSVRNLSIGAYGSAYIDYVIGIFMLAAGVNFGLYYLLWRGKGWRVLADRELRVYLCIVASATALVAADLVLSRQMSVPEGIRYAFFQVSSIQTTTGYTTADFNLWPSFSKLILVGLMIVGACAGSTGGAMKVIRLWILVKFAHRELRVMFRPRAVLSLKIAGKPVPDKVITETVGFSILYLLLLAGATLIVTAFGVDMVSAFTSVAATLGNVGPGLGIVGPMTNYGGLPDAVKVLLTFCMLAGRLELWTVFVLLRPEFWSRQ